MALTTSEKMKLINHCSKIMADLIMADITPVSLITLSRVNDQECTGIFFIVDETSLTEQLTKEACFNYITRKPDYVEQRTIHTGDSPN